MRAFGCELVITRHGQTEANLADLYQGVTDTPLTIQGISEARRLAEHLAWMRPTLVLSSDLKRAEVTADIVAACLKTTPVSLPLLRERNWGEMEGQPVNSSISANLSEFRGVESLGDLEERAKQVLATLKDTYPNQRLLLVGHQSINRMLLSVLMCNSGVLYKTLQQGNCCINIIRHDGMLRNIRVELLNSREHLGEYRTASIAS